MRKFKVAIVTLDDNYKKPLKDFLTQEWIEVDIFSSCEDCIANKNYLNYDLFIIDYLLEDCNGYLLAERIRKRVTTPIIFISEDYGESNVIRAFDIGVDEYLQKPVRLKELTIRCVYILKKYKNQLSNKIIKVNGIVYDKVQNKVFLNDTEVALTPTEMRLLRILIDKAGEVISSKELLNTVWGWDESMGTAVVSTNINRLRKKLGKEKISTVKGKGYRLEL